MTMVKLVAYTARDVCTSEGRKGRKQNKKGKRREESRVSQEDTGPHRTGDGIVYTRSENTICPPRRDEEKTQDSGFHFRYFNKHVQFERISVGRIIIIISIIII